MLDHIDKILYKFRFVFGSAFVIVCLSFLVLLISAIAGNQASANSGYSLSGSYDSPNAVTSSMAMATDEVSRSLGSIGDSVRSSMQGISSIVAHSGQYISSGLAGGGKAFVGGIATGGKAVGRGMAVGATASTHGIVSGVVFSVRIPINILGFVSSSPIVRAAIQPATKEDVPVIDPSSTPHLAATVKETPAQTASKPAPAPAIDTSPQWPMHGAITTLFWASDWPYQVHHTGIDISDGQPSGVTPIHPFKPGKVIDVIHSNVSLGNHVIVDHGNGVTSVYGHMYSTNVTVGQTVDKSTVLGSEGTTGASTGPHVHFEIRMNNEPVNPSLYVPGMP
jgi:hypothetical protein